MTATRWGFGLGTLGRDMLAALVSLYLMFYLTEVLDISGTQLAAVTAILVVMRVFDAVNDPIMGVVVDNTRSRWGKFKPWILAGAVLWGAASLLMFADLGIDGWGYVVLFTAVYIVYEVSYTINDIAYWSMLPSLTQEQKEREKIGVVARICANIGLFAIVVALVPITAWLTELLGDARSACRTRNAPASSFRSSASIGGRSLSARMARSMRASCFSALATSSSLLSSSSRTAASRS